MRQVPLGEFRSGTSTTQLRASLAVFVSANATDGAASAENTRAPNSATYGLLVVMFASLTWQILFPVAFALPGPTKPIGAVRFQTEKPL